MWLTLAVVAAIIATILFMAFMYDANRTLARQLREAQQTVDQLTVRWEREQFLRDTRYIPREDVDAMIAERLEQSRSTLKGQISEHLVPLMHDCPFDPSEMRFLGQPVDYFVVTKDREGRTELVILDVKTGQARLSTTQRAIRDAIQERRVRWCTMTVRENGVTTHFVPPYEESNE